MNAAAALNKLDEITAACGGLVNARQVRIQEMPMTPGMARKLFAGGREFEVNEEGAGALQPDGSWLWVGKP